MFRATSTRSALSYSAYRLLWTSSLFSYAGQWIQQVTLSWVAYELTGSGTLVGAILGTRAIPMILLAPLSGAAADRYSRRNILLASQVLYFASTFALGAALAYGWIRTWHLFAFILCGGAGPEGLGWLLSAVGAGGVIGGVFAAYLGRFDRLGMVQAIALFLFSVALTVIAVSPSLVFALPFVLIAGLGEMMNVTAGQTLLQISAPTEMRGRIVGLLQFNPALISLGSLLVGIATDLIGARSVTATMGALATLMGVALLVRSPRLRNLRLSQLNQEKT